MTSVSPITAGSGGTGSGTAGRPVTPPPAPAAGTGATGLPTTTAGVSAAGAPAAGTTAVGIPTAGTVAAPQAGVTAVAGSSAPTAGTLAAAAGTAAPVAGTGAPVAGSAAPVAGGPCPTGFMCTDLSTLGIVAKDGAGNEVTASCGMGAPVDCNDADPAGSCPGLPNAICAHLEIAGMMIVSCGQVCTP